MDSRSAPTSGDVPPNAGAYGGGQAYCPSGSEWYGAGNYCISGNVYTCSAAGMPAVFFQNCGYGCDSTGGIEGRGGGANTQCPSGYDWGGAGTYCISDNVYYCDSAGQFNPRINENCGYGCTVAPPGYADYCTAPSATCRPPSLPVYPTRYPTRFPTQPVYPTRYPTRFPTRFPTPPPTNSQYWCPSGSSWNGQGTYCINGAIYMCYQAGGTAQFQQNCGSRGCTSPSPYGGGGITTCPQGYDWGGNGQYCINDNIYWCNSPSQANPQMSTNCGPLGCTNAPPGQPDYCTQQSAQCNY